MSEIVVGTVSSIRRYPVKSMLGEELETVDVLAEGEIRRGDAVRLIG